jgi:hypothetical protein
MLRQIPEDGASMPVFCKILTDRWDYFRSMQPCRKDTVDPDHNQVKTLRIYARGSNGGEQMFEYREGSSVDGSQFRGWGRGDWGNGGWSGRWEGRER